jgi:toxin-antitoxin system PIN domain toxin
VSTFLADGNVLIALTVADHIHHDVAVAWFEGSDASLATCPITEGTLIRFLLREGHTTDEAISVLEVFRAQPWHRFWPDALPYERSQLGGVLGHRQVTDAYLVALATDHAERVVTFDRGLCALHGDAVHLLRPSP